MVELLVALSLWGILLAAFFPTIRSSVKGWKAQKIRSENLQAARSALEKIEIDLRNAIPFAPNAFQGSENRIAFYALMKLGESAPETIRTAVGHVEYVWEKDASGRNILRRSWMAFVPEPQSVPLKGSDTFPAAISDFSLAYHSGGSGQQVSSWRQTWSQKHIPDSVRVYLSLNNSGKDDDLSFHQVVRIPRGL